MIFTGKMHPQITQALRKSKNIDIWLIGILNQMFMRGFCTRITFSKI